jgi:DNA-binding Xre family transcriptional regulator
MKIELKNRLDILIKDAGFRSFEEFTKKVNENGWSINRTSINRKARDENISLSLSMLEAICNTLQCMPGDLYEVNISDATKDEVDSLQSRLNPFKYGAIHTQVSSTNANDDTKTVTSEPVAENGNSQHTSNEDLSNILGPSSVPHVDINKLLNKDDK